MAKSTEAGSKPPWATAFGSSAGASKRNREERRQRHDDRRVASNGTFPPSVTSEAGAVNRPDTGHGIGAWPRYPRPVTRSGDLATRRDGPEAASWRSALRGQATGGRRSAQRARPVPASRSRRAPDRSERPGRATPGAGRYASARAGSDPGVASPSGRERNLRRNLLLDQNDYASGIIHQPKSDRRKTKAADPRNPPGKAGRFVIRDQEYFITAAFPRRKYPVREEDSATAWINR